MLPVRAAACLQTKAWLQFQRLLHRCKRDAIGHGHAIAKGVDIRTIMAELYAKRTGCCKGKGGSMHLGDLSKGMVPAVAIVGGGLPIATGVGLTFKMRKEDRVAVAFMGDGATNEGTFHESLNQGQLQEIYESADQQLKTGVSAQDFTSFLAAVRRKLGRRPLVFVVGVPEILRRTQQVSARTNEPFIAFGAAMLLYLALTLITTQLLQWLERRYRLQT